jgi:hypothetical protein
MNENVTAAASQEYVDGLLNSFFKKEIPHPWPAAKLPSVERVSAHFWFGSTRRLALVASVALLLLGYLALATKFPTSSESGVGVDRHQTIGSNPQVKPLSQHK